MQFPNATILSDRQIRALCEVPVGQMRFIDSRVFGVQTERVLPFYANQVADLRNHSIRIARLFGARENHVPHIEMFDEETLARLRKNFKPMIEPFFPNQEKLHERNATEEEILYAMSLQGKGQDRDAILKEFQKKSPAVQGLRNDPLLGLQVREKMVSKGLSSFGYDVTCGREFKIFTNVNSAIVDPKNFDSNSFVDVVTTDEKPYIIIPPNSFALAVTKEYFRIPRNVLTVCLGKSTYARCGIIVNVTPFEPEWEGYVTLEFSNTTPLPAKVYADEGCAQVLFFQGSEPCEVSYKDRGGKYQGQVGLPVTPKV